MGSINAASQGNGLIAVLFLTRSRPGPRLHFHYPAKPQWPLATPKSQRRHHDNDSNSDSESDSDPGEDIKDQSISNALTSTSRESGNNDSETPDLGGSSFANKTATTNTSLLGYSIENLEKLLSPGRWCDRKKFEVCVDGLTFVGHPIYAGQNGKWSVDEGENETKPTIRPTKSIATLNEDEDENEAIQNETTEDADEYTGATTSAKITITAPEDATKSPHDFTHIPASLDSQGGVSLATSMNSASTTSGVNHDQMTMFHVIFVIASDQNSPASDMYQHVAKKFSKALHYCQKESSYVAVQSRAMVAVKTKAKAERLGTDALYMQLLENSQLAWALKEVFDSISIGNVARVRLDGSEISVHIPPYIHSPLDIDPILGPHSGLLFLEDKEVLLREIAGGEASPLSFFIREQTPTKTLQKHSVIMGLPIDDILYLARHLIKWRKARVITPLHQRNYYVVSPDAPTDRIASLIPDYASRFAALPSLPQMLKILSGKPIKYVMLMPSRDHRMPYMAILSYLVRHRFVVQLKTFGWLRCSKELRVSAISTLKKEAKYETPRSLLSPQLRPNDDDAASVQSHETAIPFGNLAERPKLGSRRSSAGTNDTAVKDKPSDQSTASIIVLNPTSPTNSELDAIDRIQASIAEDEESQRLLYSLLPYMNGERAFEEIGAREGLKRSHVERALELLEKKGHLLTFRHI